MKAKIEPQAKHTKSVPLWSLGKLYSLYKAQFVLYLHKQLSVTESQDVRIRKHIIDYLVLFLEIEALEYKMIHLIFHS